MFFLAEDVALHHVSWPLNDKSKNIDDISHNFYYSEKEFLAKYKIYKSLEPAKVIALSHLLAEEEYPDIQDCTNGFIIKKDCRTSVILSSANAKLKKDISHDDILKYVLPLPLLHFLSCVIWLRGNEALMLISEKGGFILHYSNGSNFEATDLQHPLRKLYYEIDTL